MATFDFNTLMATAKSASFEALPAGDYDAECISADAVTSSTGKPMIKCKFEVLTGPHAKRKFFNQFVVSTESEVALAMFFRHMKAFGLDESFFAAVGQGGLAPVATSLLGRRAKFTLGIRKWQDEDRNEVKAVKPLAGGIAAAPGGLPGAGAPGLPGLPSSAAPATPAPAVAPVTQPTTPAVAPQPAVATPVPPVAAPPEAPATPAAVAEPAPPVQPVQPPVQPVEAPAPVQAPVQPEPVAPPAAPVAPPAQPADPQPADPQPTPPADQVSAAAPAVQPPPPMPF